MHGNNTTVLQGEGSCKMNFPKKPPFGFLFLIIYFCQNLDSFQLFIETESNVFISKEVPRS